MAIIEEVLKLLPEEPVPVQNIIVGVHWTLVNSKYCGLGSTLVDEGPHGHSRVRDVGMLSGKSAQELAGWIRSDNQLEASIGIAAINSLLELDESRMDQINAAEVIARRCKGRDLVIVGHFPFVDRIKGLAKNCWVIEKRISGDDLPEEAATEFIPRADVVAITGTAFINHTMDNLLALCRPGSEVLILGPSTPMTPLLFDHGVSFLSGSRVIDVKSAINTIQEGASFPQVKGVRLLTMTKEKK